MSLIREVRKSVEKTVLFDEMVSFISLSTLHVLGENLFCVGVLPQPRLDINVSTFLQTIKNMYG